VLVLESWLLNASRFSLCGSRANALGVEAVPQRKGLIRNGQMPPKRARCIAKFDTPSHPGILPENGCPVDAVRSSMSGSPQLVEQPLAQLVRTAQICLAKWLEQDAHSSLFERSRPDGVIGLGCDEDGRNFWPRSRSFCAIRVRS